MSAVATPAHGVAGTQFSYIRKDMTGCRKFYFTLRPKTGRRPEGPPGRPPPDHRRQLWDTQPDLTHSAISSQRINHLKAVIRDFGAALPSRLLI